MNSQLDRIEILLLEIKKLLTRLVDAQELENA